MSVQRTAWAELLDELERRGQGRRESGAFLLADREGGSRLVSDIVYFDDLDPECLTGAIHLHQSAFSKLWDLCDDRGLRVVADVHTHPGSSVRQSYIDQEHPMVAMRGHVGVIVPNFAEGDIAPRHVGVHVYEGEAGWTSFFSEDAELRLRLIA